MRVPPASRMEAALEDLEKLHDLLEKVGSECDEKQNEYDSAYSRAIAKAKGSNEASRKAEAFLSCEDISHELTILRGKKDRIERKIRSTIEVLSTLRSLNVNTRVLTGDAA